MAIRASITLIAALVSAALLVPVSAAPASAHDLLGVCSAADLKAHPTWFRPGGYCEVTADMSGAVQFAHLGGGRAFGSPGDPYGPVTGTLYYDKTTGQYTNTEPSGPHDTFVYHDRVVVGTSSSGSTELFYRY